MTALKPWEGMGCILRTRSCWEMMILIYKHATRTILSRHPSEASFVGAGSLAEGSSVSVWFTPLSLCSRPERANWWGSWYWSEPWMGALDLRLHLKAIKEALLQSNVFHWGARGGGGHLHYVNLFRLGAEADRASWASLSLDPTTLTITEKKATQKHIRFRLIYGIWWQEYSSQSNLDISRLNWCKALTELIHRSSV